MLILLPILLSEDQSLFEIALPLVMGVFSYYLFKKMAWDLCDEVYDYGSHLLFKKAGKEQRVYFKDVKNINYSYMTSPERVEIDTRKEGEIGSTLVFTPPYRFKFNPFKKDPLITELIERIDRYRN